MSSGMRIEVTCPTLALSGNSPGIYFRYIDATNYSSYAINTTGNVFPVSVVAGTPTYYTGSTITKAPGDRYTVEVSSSNVVSFFQNGNLIRTNTVPENLTSTKSGIGVSFDGTTTFDNFSIVAYGTPISRADSFNRADGAIGTPSDAGTTWTPITGTFNVLSNQAKNNSGSGLAVLQSYSYIGSVQATITNIGAGPGLVIRCADALNYIKVVITTAGLTLYKMVGGVQTSVGTYTGTIANGDTVLLQSDSFNNIIVRQNGTLRITAAVAEGYYNTMHGISADADTTSTFDNFVYTDGIVGLYNPQVVYQFRNRK
jgi:hypothetical protein